MALEKAFEIEKNWGRIFEKENEERLNYDSHAFLYFVASLYIDEVSLYGLEAGV